MLQLIHAPVAAPKMALPEIAVRAERASAVKRRWRGAAEDGSEFGFDLEKPIRDGDVVWETASARYVLRQIPEAVVEIALHEMAASAVAGIGWAIGNLHLELMAEPTRLLAPDEPAVRALLERLNVAFKATTAVFRPGRFARGEQQASHELGRSHQH